MSSFTSEEIAQLRKVQKRCFIPTLVLGTIMTILGYFAGQKLAGGNTSGADTVHTDAAITAAVGECTPTAADFERTE